MTESTDIVGGIDSYRIIKFVEINGEDGKDVGVLGFAVIKDSEILQCFRGDNDPSNAITWLNNHLGNGDSMPNQRGEEDLIAEHSNTCCFSYRSNQ